MAQLQPDKTYAECKFLYGLLADGHWVSRKVDHRTCRGSELWERTCSLDLDFAMAHTYFEQQLCDRPPIAQAYDESSVVRPKDVFRTSNGVESLYIPVHCLTKELLLSDFDLRDGEGKAVSHVNIERASHLSVSALFGAVICEAEEAQEAKAQHRPYNAALLEHELADPIYGKAGLRDLLVDKLAAKETDLPIRDDEHYEEYLAELDQAVLEDHLWGIDYLLMLPSLKPEERRTLIAWCETVDDFRFYLAHSLRFRYFIDLLSRKTILWVAFKDDPGDRGFIKSHSKVVQNLFSTAHRPGAGRVVLEVDLDDLPLSMNHHIELQAPTGTVIYPLKPKMIGWKETQVTYAGEQWKPELTPIAIHVHNRDYQIAVGELTEKFPGGLDVKYADLVSEALARIDAESGEQEPDVAENASGSDTTENTSELISAETASEQDENSSKSLFQMVDTSAYHGSYAPETASLWRHLFVPADPQNNPNISEIPSIVPNRETILERSPFIAVPSEGYTSIPAHGLLFGLAPIRGKTARLYLAVAVISLCLWGIFFAYLWAGELDSEKVLGIVIPILGIFMPIVSLIFTVEDKMGETPVELYAMPRRCCRIILAFDIGLLGLLLVMCGAAQSSAGAFAGIVTNVVTWMDGIFSFLQAWIPAPTDVTLFAMWLVVLLLGIVPSIVVFALVSSWLLRIKPKEKPLDWGFDDKRFEAVGVTMLLTKVRDEDLEHPEWLIPYSTVHSM